MLSSTLRKSIAARRAEEGDKGFTLIELMVVVLIIGILAAIAIPVFIGQQNSAKDAAVQSDLSNAKLAMIGYFTAGGTVANVSSANLQPYGYPSSPSGSNLTYYVTGGSSTAFCISEASGSGTTFKVLASSSTISSTTTSCSSLTG
jgi:prepilin-type N-terminal cleavage/methylation domain-containing protein